MIEYKDILKEKSVEDVYKGTPTKSREDLVVDKLFSILIKKDEKFSGSKKRLKTLMAKILASGKVRVKKDKDKKEIYDTEFINNMLKVIGEIILRKQKECLGTDKEIKSDGGIEKFRTSSYAHNRIYDKTGKPCEYTRILNYIDDVGTSDVFNLVVVSKDATNKLSNYNLYDDFDEIKILRRYGGKVKDLIRMKILDNVGGVAESGKNFDEYYSYVLAREKELEEDGVKVIKY